MKFNQIYDIAMENNDAAESFTTSYDVESNQYTTTFIGLDWDLETVYLFGQENFVLYLNLYDESTNTRYVMFSDDYQPTEAEYLPTDDERVVELELEEDFIEKYTAIVAGDWYDPRILIPVDFTDEEFIMIATAAHVKDMTLNEFIEYSLTEFMAMEDARMSSDED